MNSTNCCAIIGGTTAACIIAAIIIVIVLLLTGGPSVVTHDYNSNYKQTFTAEVVGNRLMMKHRFQQNTINKPTIWY